MGVVGKVFEDKNANEGRTVWCFPTHKLFFTICSSCNKASLNYFRVQQSFVFSAMEEKHRQRYFPFSLKDAQ